MNSVADGQGRSDLHGYRADIHEEPRRGFMQKLGAFVAPIVASVPGLSGRVSARERDDLSEVRAEYKSQDRVKAAFDKHASDLISGLTDEGVLDHDSVEKFLAESETKVSAIRVDGTPTAHLEANRELPSGEILSAFVQPGVGRSYALRREEYHGSVTIYDTSAKDSWGVTPQCTAGGACYNTFCIDDTRYDSYKETYCCTGGNCYTGSETNCCPRGYNGRCSDAC